MSKKNDTVFEIVRHHPLAVSLVAIIAFFATPYISYQAGLHTAHENQLRELRFSEYEKVTDAENALNAALDDFTKYLTTKNKTDPKLARVLEKSIAVQYGAIDTYMRNVSDEMKPKLIVYKTELALMKTNLHNVKTLQDLEHFGTNIVRVLEARKRAKPAFAVSIGRS